MLQRIWVKWVKRHLRNAAVQREFASGKTINALAVTYRLSARQIYRIVQLPTPRTTRASHVHAAPSSTVRGSDS